MKILIFVFTAGFAFSYAERYKVTDQVFLDVGVRGNYLGSIIIGLFGEIAPLTAKNFHVIATEGINGSTYAGTKFHRVIRKFMIQGGDIVNRDGTGSLSIYGKSFQDENFLVNFTGPGFVAMANMGPNTNGCQFFITTIATPWLNGLHTIFGKVVQGQNVVHQIELMKIDTADRPLRSVKIIKSGAIEIPTPFYVTDDPYEYVYKSEEKSL